MSAVCWKCVNDEHLRAIIREKGEVLQCSECTARKRKAFSAESLAELLDPVLQEHYLPANNYRGEQEGDPLSHIVQEALGEDLNFYDEIVDALIENDGFRPQDGEDPFFSNDVSYVSRRIGVYALRDWWHSATEDLKHSKRFFSSTAKELFEHLFSDIEARTCWDVAQRRHITVVVELPEGSELFRARALESIEELKNALKDPLKNIGPPPPARARANRMNVEGVAVFYGALESETCLAELRPNIGGEAAVIKIRTTKTLRLIDFTKIKNSARALSYFQPDFNQQAEKNIFLRQLGSLISQPVRPGKEADYLITQTMAEYLAHVHAKPFDGLLYKSVQKKGGKNIVLFPHRRTVADNAFSIAYVDESIKFFETSAIEYEHIERRVTAMDDGEIIDYTGYDRLDEDDE